MITYITSTSAPTPQVNHNSTACTPRPDEMIRYKCTKRDVSLGNFQQSNDKKNTGIKRRRSLFSGVVDGWMAQGLGPTDGWKWRRTRKMQLVSSNGILCGHATTIQMQKYGAMYWHFVFLSLSSKTYWLIFFNVSIFFPIHNSKISHEVILRFNGKINVFKQKIAVIFYSKSYGR